MSFHPGQLVVCVDADVATSPLRGIDMDFEQLRRGQIYTIRDVGVDPRQPIPVVFLDEIKRRPVNITFGVECGWSAHRFRPLADDRIAIFRNLLQPAPKQKAPPVPAVVG